MDDSPVIICDASSLYMPDMDYAKIKPLEDKEYGDYPEDYLYIKIDPWTKYKDVRNTWPQVDRSKKEIFGFSQIERCKFSRDLCWFDLNKNNKRLFNTYNYLNINKL